MAVRCPARNKSHIAPLLETSEIPSGLNTRNMSDAEREWKPKARPQSCVIFPSGYI